MSFTSLVTSSTLLPPASTLATITGIMSGEIRIMVGEPTPSSNLAFTWSSRLEISMEAESILVPCSNSSMTILAFSLDMELTLFTPDKVLRADSIGFVTLDSTFSGLAPA